MNETSDPESAERNGRRAAIACAHFHLKIGWWSLLLFVTAGLVLEAFHGFKVGWYLDPAFETRRLMWTLAHAHGTLVGLVHLGFAATAGSMPAWNPASRTLASRCLLAAGVLLPLGFFLGGTMPHAGDPNLGILLVPPAGLLLLAAVAVTAFGVSSRHHRG